MHATFPKDDAGKQLAMFPTTNTSPSNRVLLTVHQVAAAFGVAPSTVSRWPLAHREQSGRETFVDLAEVVQLRLRELNHLDLTQERARLASAQADKAQLANAEHARKLIDVTTAMDVFASQIVVAKNQLLALGSKLAFELCLIARAPSTDSHKFAELVDREIRQVLEELSVGRAADALEVPAPTADDDLEVMSLEAEDVAGEGSLVTVTSEDPPAALPPDPPAPEAPPTKRRQRARKAVADD